MSFLLDTNICSNYLVRPVNLAHRFVQYAGRLSVPTIVLAELYFWAYNRPNPVPFLTAIETFRGEVDILGFDESCARMFGQLRSILRPLGVTVPPMDLLI